ncbi:Uncharacterised protein [Legionella lansingensis]|uniref:Uncharacterized protein n=1 Tax=Legionella lansingensis TaxID=45067 RepID=A0A0W0VGQ9_9GAMM|nr:hypothetical protein [Legionella lansingensis]KTD19258.1 hypothetical protein Llan_2110 [Legionella lansingensis]SNV50586.1 Uncharacterised protein [Legionella lansingensis]
MLIGFFSKGIKLKDNFRQERKEQRELQTKYGVSDYLIPLAAELSCELSCNNGVFSFPNGHKPDGMYLYVRTLKGKIFAAELGGSIRHHSYLSNGKKVLSAGHFFFDHGKLILVSNESGHYTPTNEEMLSEIEFYYSISKNEDLIYEDHSNVPTSKQVHRYKAQDIVRAKDITRVQPIITINDAKSNFGKILPRFFAAKVNQNKGTSEKTSHYLSDSQLLDKTEGSSDFKENEKTQRYTPDSDLSNNIGNDANKNVTTSHYLQDHLLFVKAKDASDPENKLKYLIQDEAGLSLIDPMENPLPS